MPVMLYLYVPNADAAYQLALKAGATSIMEPEINSTAIARVA